MTENDGRYGESGNSCIQEYVTHTFIFGRKIDATFLTLIFMLNNFVFRSAAQSISFEMRTEKSVNEIFFHSYGDSLLWLLQFDFDGAEPTLDRRHGDIQ